MNFIPSRAREREREEEEEEDLFIALSLAFRLENRARFLNNSKDFRGQFSILAIHSNVIVDKLWLGDSIEVEIGGVKSWMKIFESNFRSMLIV